MTKSRFIRNQLFGTGYITAFIGLCTAGLFLYEKVNPSYAETRVGVSGYDGDGRKGMFVLWLLLLLVFTIINLVLFFHRSLKQKR